MEFLDRFEELLKNSGVTAYKLSKATGISPGLISDYRKKRSKPSQDNLRKIATYFNVTVDYLLGSENPDSVDGESQIDPVKADMLRKANSLNQDEMKLVENYMDYIISQRNAK